MFGGIIQTPSVPGDNLHDSWEKKWDGCTSKLSQNNSAIIDYRQQMFWQIQGKSICGEALIIKQNIKVHPFNF